MSDTNVLYVNLLVLFVFVCLCFSSFYTGFSQWEFCFHSRDVEWFKICFIPTFLTKISFTSWLFHFIIFDRRKIFLESNPRKSFLTQKIKNIKNSALAFIPCLRQKCNELRIFGHVIDRNCHMIASTAIKL